ncbi:MAG TPA: efflux RND transporter periplasmic adaptor subunit, partial [Devosia sp.]|nr:efflux RND transporter periplasmic adaptor subunit [Devosia sp.]
DFVVSESTGTFSIRATFPNPRRLLLPGMFVRATVDLGTEPDGFLVPQRAVTFNASGQATAFFVENGKAASHVLTTTGTNGNDWVVTAGVTDGAQLIVDGLQKVSDGSAVTPVPVTLNDQGVAVDAAASSAPPASGAPPAAPASSSAPAASASSAAAG